MGSHKICAAPVRFGKVAPAEMRPREVYLKEILFGKICMAQICFNISVLSYPRIPRHMRRINVTGVA